MTSFIDKLITELQSNGGVGVSSDDIEDIFEDMLDEAIYDETHVTVTIHATSTLIDYINSSQGGLYWDSEGNHDAITGEIEGTLIIPDDNNDYIIEGVVFGRHYVYPAIYYHYDSDNFFEIENENSSSVVIDKDHYEFYANDIGQPQVTTQQEI